MSSPLGPRASRGLFGRGLSCRKAKCWRPQRRGDESGFTLVELLIVSVIAPVIVGALSVGLIAVFSLQSSVANRLGDTADSQVVSSTFLNDVQSAAAITTDPYLQSAECGPSSETQLLGLAWEVNPQGGYDTVVSYAEVPNGSQWNLVRQYCANGYSSTPTSSSVVSYNVEQPCTEIVTQDCQNPPAVYDSAGLLTGSNGPSNGWVQVLNGANSGLGAQNVTKVEFTIAEPNSTESGGAYTYTLAGVPAAYTPVNENPQAPVNSETTSGCNFASPGTGYYWASLCLVDFTSALTPNNLDAAETYNAAKGICGLQMEANLPGGAELFFCLGITGGPVESAALPTWENAFLGNSCSPGAQSCTTGTPFYTGVAGEPAIYQTTGSGSTTNIYFSNISVVNAQGVAATGWQIVSADAESTDSGESITWTSNTPLTILNNDESYDTASDPVGNACGGTSGVGGSGLTESSNDLTVECVGYTTTTVIDGKTENTVKTGTAMVSATMPSTMDVTMVGTGLEGIVFGALLS